MTITYAQEPRISVAEYQAVVGSSSMALRRPLANIERLETMLANSNFTVTARDDAGTLVGFSRSLSDTVWVAYCADLVVDERVQGQGIGKALLERTKELLGPKVMLVLIAAQGAAGFYEKLGMARVADTFIFERADRS